ncbi:MFS transporter [Oceanobacillus senegalensis]|uniref:MFS transporter n=1 Tax=Oceanobacillus senegalensis TaxID=1936063 RepID=UPI000A30C43B|nr:MFS transporter [Oceanobacillus senegalensis]
MIFNMLRIRNFRFFFLSEIIYAFGVGMSTVGANWYLMDQTNSTTAVGGMLALNVIAGFMISPLIGTLTDRLNRKTIIIWTYFIQALLILGVAGLFIFDEFKIGYLYLFSMVNGMGWTTYMSTSRSLLQEILSEKEMITGNSLVEICLQVGMFTAGGLSGAFYQVAGFEFILISNSIAFIFSGLLLSRVKHQSVMKDNNDETYLASFTSGMKYLLTRMNVFFIGMVAIIPLVATMMYNVVLPEYVNDSVNGSSIDFGVSDMFYGIGGFLSGMLAEPFAKKFSRNRSVTILFLVSISFLFALSLNTYILFLFLGSLMFGLCNSSLRILMNTTIMETVPKSYMGRAMSVWTAIALMLQAMISPGLGVLIDSYSPGLGFLVLSGLMLVGVILHLIVMYMRSNRYKNENSHTIKQTIND